ncbi:MAG TPA: glycoside hydrolase family 130 protein, partial [Puia sp.]|nr:glycoside hydrolase family 130 protein [Puia sp.]
LDAFLTKEYSIEAAALFNPSVVPHPDQSELNPGEKRFVMSLRATGEGHISSIVFHTGTVDRQGNIKLDPSSGYHNLLYKKEDARYEKNFILKYTGFVPGFKTSILDILPDSFTERQAKNILTSSPGIDQTMVYSARILEEFMDMNYELDSTQPVPINEQVIFPTAAGESMGMEDVRFVKFEDASEVCYYGTYTAYNGKQIRTQLIETKNFEQYKVRTLNGPAVSDKGMALFPEKINGKYAMISRQGGENINIMFSDDLCFWEKFQVLMEPRFTWEFVQLGNCGSPLRTEKGWLLLTHGVGAMRKYVISAILLDLLDPTQIIGRLDKPLIEADESEREGYVPNVVYTCGFMQHGDLLIIPYAVSDSATGFVTILLNDLLGEFKL